MLPPKENFEREKVPFQSAYDWMDDEKNRVSPNTVQTGVEWVVFVVAIVLLCMAVFN